MLYNQQYVLENPILIIITLGNLVMVGYYTLMSTKIHRPEIF